MYVSFIMVRFRNVSSKLYVLIICVYVSFIGRFSVSLGMGDSGGHSKDILLGLGSGSSGMLSVLGSGVVGVLDRDIGVREKGGAGSAQRSFDIEVSVSVRVSDMSSEDGVGVGWGAG